MKSSSSSSCSSSSEDDEGISLFASASASTHTTSSSNDSISSKKLHVKNKKRGRESEPSMTHNVHNFISSDEEGNNNNNNETVVKNKKLITSFQELGLSNWIVKSCNALGMIKPTPIQQYCIPPALAGRNVIGSALTGSGKTAAFALPILQKLSENPYGIFALIITPTRELAAQIGEQFHALGAKLPVRECIVVGGLDMMKQSVQLDRLPHVVICTPGRMADHMNGARPPKLHKLRFLVLDEADRLFEKTFARDMEFIISRLPKKNRQTLLFSATMSYNVRKSQTLAVNEPFVWTNDEGETTVDNLTQEYLFIPSNVKPTYLYKILDRLGPKREDEIDEEEEAELIRKGGKRRYKSVIIFASTCAQCQLLNQMLAELRIYSASLHSQMSQRRRFAALGKFKSGKTSLLIATDVASRGLDIPQVELVLNYDIPRNAADYIHRVGRTARAGRKGNAISLVSQYDIELVKNVEKHVGRKMDECKDVKEDDVLLSLNKVTKAIRAAKIFLAENELDEESMKRKKAKRQRNER
jgi:ATP-dependent RNA helicase DDX49/DBP8